MSDIDGLHGEPDSTRLILYRNKYNEQGLLVNMEPIEERKTGKWYKPQGYPRDSYRFICDNCHDVAYYVTGNNGKKNKSDNPKCGYHYCPNCGADMRGEHNG